MKITNNNNEISLRRRFKIFTSLLVIFILLCAGYGYQRLSTTQSAVEANLEQRNSMLAATYILRATLLDVYQAINLFLLEPDQSKHRDKIYQSLNEILSLSKQLADENSGLRDEVQNDFRQLHETLLGFEADIAELIKIRLDPYRQYPALAVSATTMLPNQRKVSSVFSLVLNVLNDEDKINKHTQVLQSFIQARHLWSQVLLNFRLYIANRMGAFNVAALPRQEKSISAMYSRYMLELNDLGKLIEKGVVDLEISHAYEVLHESAGKWFAGFEQVKYIHATNEWRIDTKLMKDKITPWVALANNILKRMNGRLVEESENDILELSKVASQQTAVLWVVAGLAIFFIVFVFISIERFFLIPIGMITAALKQEALGKTHQELPRVHSRETKDLIDAFAEMSKQIHLRQKELEHRALHDELTALPNRTLLFDHVEHDVLIAKRDNTALSLLMIDLDLFKEVNDTFGHAVGDQLLIELGKRLKLVLREVDIVARMGGDEFAILLPGVGLEHVSSIAEKVFKASQLPYIINELELVVAASVGVAVYPEHGEDAQELLRHADVAMYVAKHNKLGFSIYDSHQDQYSIMRFAMIAALREAIKNNEIDLYFQPKLDLRSGKVLSVEALLRWRHPEHGFVSPEVIVELAEQTGLIKQLTHWVAENAMLQLAAWQAKKIDIGISINISAHNLKDKGFVAEIRDLVNKHDIKCDLLTLEITENAMMSDPVLAVKTLREFSEMGFKISVDDYGTGFSSLSYLSKLPVDELKIDKSFVIDMDTIASNETIVRSTIELAHNLGLKVVAEGIETQLIWNMLRSYGCDQGQGYLMSKPIPVMEFESWLSQREKAVG